MSLRCFIKTRSRKQLNVVSHQTLINKICLRRGFRWGLLTFAHIKSKKKEISERYTIKTALISLLMKRKKSLFFSYKFKLTD